MVGQFDNSNKPMIDKKIVWDIKHGELQLSEEEEKFSDIELKDFKGNFMLYSNKETKCDVDIHRIVMENFCDPEAYRLVLYPGYSLKNPQKLDHMVKIRIRDKFVIVDDTPWKVFDQFEIFLNSMSVTLTRKFYKKLQQFMLLKQELKKIDDLQSSNQEDLTSRPKTFVGHDENFTDLLPQSMAKLKDFKRTESNTSDMKYYTPSSESEEDKDDFIANSAKDFQKARAKTMVMKDTSHKKSGFSFNSLSKMITNKVRKIRNYKKKDKNDQTVRYPVFFRYFRINEIGVSLTYKHSNNSWLNTKNLRIVIKPFIKHCKFITLQKMLSKYESFCKKSLIYQLPSIIKQKILKITLAKDNDDDFEDDLEDDIKSMKSRMILFGNYAKI